MTNAALSQFRAIHAAMQTEPTNWQWIGRHMSQRMFGITKTRAQDLAKHHGGTAQEIAPLSFPLTYDF
jgi:hypothetical protein